VATTTLRKSLHCLVDVVPDTALDEAVRYLEALTADDAVLRAILLVPEDDEPESDEERLTTADAGADAAAGRPVSHAEAHCRPLAVTGCDQTGSDLIGSSYWCGMWHPGPMDRAGRGLPRLE
jgi:hypothetical protein